MDALTSLVAKLAQYRPTSPAAALLLSLPILLALIMPLFGLNRFPLENKNVFIAGGSQGLGLSLAKLCATRGAHVTIVARTTAKLESALQEVEICRKNDKQRLHLISADLSTPEGTEAAFDAYSGRNQGIATPDYVLVCAGGAGGIMGFFTDLTAEQLQQGLSTNYNTALWSAHTAAKRMVQSRVQGKIVLVSSIAGLMSFAGYSAYSPAKYALRGLADALRNEFILHGITIHCYFPGTIFTPGYQEEMKTKPALTVAIEGPEEGNTPDVLADRLIKGLEKGQFMISTDPIGHLFRMGSRGLSPATNSLTDVFWAIAGTVGIPVWRMIADGQVRTHAKKQAAQS